MKKLSFRILLIVMLFGISLFTAIAMDSKNVYAFSQESGQGSSSGNVISLPNVAITPSEVDNPAQTASALQTLFLFAIIALVPTLILMVTCFPRILIVLHFLRSALGTQQMPPNQILIALALFLTVFMLQGQIKEIGDEAFGPYSRGEITQEIAIERALVPIRKFMATQVEPDDLRLFAELSNHPYTIENIDDVPTEVLIPAFMIGELTKGFKMGFLIYIPFIVIDMVVASTLMAMGMMMLPPAMISLPFKILIFVVAGGWNMVINQLYLTFMR